MGDSKIPDIFTDYELPEVSLLGSVNEGILHKMAANNNLLLDLIPIGTIIYVNENQDGAVSPNSSYWQYCDGSEITNPSSPIRSIGIFQSFCPDLRDKFPRGANDQIANNAGGSSSYNLNHAHSTGGSGGGGGMDENDKGPGDRLHMPAHAHGVSGDLANETIIEPQHINFNAYMKVI